ncbi:MAG TPA: stage III sporulation protein AG [Lachnospiraceae bacterium]|nr:stage III sporulation protein AG [Lachnospiraceae bacterium]
MGRNWKQWASDKGVQKWFRRDNFIVLVLTGILLVIIALPTRDGTSGEESGEPEGKSDILSFTETEAGGGVSGSSAENGGEEGYAAYLEGRLKSLLSRTAEVGKVDVMITLKSSRELVVEKEQPVSRSSTNENDSQGGTRSVSQVDSEENTVYRTEGNASEPYVIKTLSPEIEGVLVVAEGAGSGTVNRTIVEIAQALFGVEAHKVKVVKMEETHSMEEAHSIEEAHSMEEVYSMGETRSMGENNSAEEVQ